MAYCFPRAKIVAIDAGIEGKDNMFGIKLTNHIAEEEGLSVTVEYGFSPEDTKGVISKHFCKNKIDIVFIDGLHTNEQLLKDFYGVREFCYQKTIFMFHDVINWKMERAFHKIEKFLIDYESLLLYRTTSGMGVSFPQDISQDIKDVFYLFTEKKEYIEALNRLSSIKGKVSSIVGRLLPKLIKSKLKRIIR